MSTRSTLLLAALFCRFWDGRRKKYLHLISTLYYSSTVTRVRKNEWTPRTGPSSRTHWCQQSGVCEMRHGEWVRPRECTRRIPHELNTSLPRVVPSHRSAGKAGSRAGLGDASTASAGRPVSGRSYKAPAAGDRRCNDEGG